MRDLLEGDYAWTPRQREVLDLLAHSKSNQEIADTLGISLDGAKWHMREILSKLGVPTREEAADYWRRHNRLRARLRRVGWLGLPGWVLGRAGAAAAVIGLVIAVAVLVVVFRGSDGDSPRLVADTPERAGSPSPATTIAGRPGCANPPTIRLGRPGLLTMSPFVRLNGHTYDMGPDPGPLTTRDLGPVLGRVLVAPDPRGDPCFRRVEGASVGLSEGTELRQVAGFDPALRLGADIGGQLRLFERVPLPDDFTFVGSGGFTGTLTLAQTVPDSDLIVRATVEAIEDGNRDTRPGAVSPIYRIAQVRVAEVLHGVGPAAIVRVFVPGGTSGGSSVRVSDWGPALNEGDDVILFLYRPGRFPSVPDGLWEAFVDFHVSANEAVDSHGQAVDADSLSDAILDFMP
jgi:DNA-binding CsgD family transcriptional regulator